MNVGEVITGRFAGKELIHVAGIAAMHFCSPLFIAVINNIEQEIIVGGADHGEIFRVIPYE
ncbi:hypothetical protein D9M69_642200 [compost metagenome]